MTTFDFQAVVTDERWDFNFMGDYTAYPQDVWESLIEFCVLWNFSAPTFSRKSKDGSRAVMWLNSLRELQEVCAEYGLEALRDYRNEFERYMQRNNGLAPHTVSSPKSLLNVVAGHVATMRSRPPEPEASTFEFEIEEKETICIHTDLLGITEDGKERRSHFCRKPTDGGKYCEEHMGLYE